MNADTLRLAVRDHFRACAADFGMSADTVEATYVLNWGGFVNYSYRVSDGRRSYHLKLGVDDERRSALQRWYELRHLMSPYHTPPIVAWVRLDGAAGLLFEVVPGTVPALQPEVIDALMPMLSRLFADDALARALREEDSAVTARDGYLHSFHRRFTEDLVGIGKAPPPFVNASLLRWMRHEVDRLRDAIFAAPPFDEPLTSAVHGDLWLNNMHWVDPGEWYLLDWDDLRIGDPAADVATLLGPTADDLRPLKLVERAHAAVTPLQLTRLPLLGRATLLDWVIDPLSDWLDADVSPAHVDLVRAEKERVHREALRCFREHYG